MASQLEVPRYSLEDIDALVRQTTVCSSCLVIFDPQASDSGRQLSPELSGPLLESKQGLPQPGKHHGSYEGLCQSARQGCPICIFISKGLQPPRNRLRNYQFNSTFSTTKANDFILKTWFGPRTSSEHGTRSLRLRTVNCKRCIN